MYNGGMNIQNIFKKQGIVKVAPDVALSQALKSLSSSHDAAFVFDGSDFLGVINPYYCCIKKAYPPTAKVKNTLVKPPKIDVQAKVPEVARLMVESKIHYLPVFQGNEFAGIITAPRLLRYMQKDEMFAVTLHEFSISRKPLITVMEDDSIEKAMGMFKRHKISKLLVLGKSMKLSGILTYYDIIDLVSKPQTGKSKNFKKESVLNSKQQKVRSYYQKKVIFIGDDKMASDALKMMIDREVGSVVVTNSQKQPVSIITTNDILNIISSKGVAKQLTVHTDHVPAGKEHILKQFIKSMRNLLFKKKDVTKASLTIHGNKTEDVFQATVLTEGGKNGRSTRRVVKEEGKNFSKVLKSVKKRTKNI